MKQVVLSFEKDYILVERTNRRKPQEEVGMPGLAIVTLVLLVVLAALVVIFLKVRQKDLLGAIMDKRRPSSKLVSRADYVEGVEKIPVALSLSEDSLYYENPDLDASFELNRIEEIEYSDDLSTGRSHDAQYEVLRLRSHGATFEFLLEKPECKKWMDALPPRRIGGEPSARAV